VGSIKPRPQLVRIIGDIGKILAGKRGEIELRGHTDARAYAGKNYDNWRLSSDRATLVNYMLIRGGLPAARIGKIVGFADRRPKNAADPLSPVNRRIEILLRTPDK
jgi:chemotaxis protein MotB